MLSSPLGSIFNSHFSFRFLLSLSLPILTAVVSSTVVPFPPAWFFRLLSLPLVFTFIVSLFGNTSACIEEHNSFLDYSRASLFYRGSFIRASLFNSLFYFLSLFLSPFFLVNERRFQRSRAVSRFFAHSGKVDNFLLAPRISFPPLSHPFPPRSHSWCTRACTLTLCHCRRQVYTVDWLLIISQVAQCRRMWQQMWTNDRFIAMQMKKELSVVQTLRVIIRANIFSIHPVSFPPFFLQKNSNLQST